jgi:hypothetical protein
MHADTSPTIRSDRRARAVPPVTMVIARAVNWCGRGGFAPAARESEQWWRVCRRVVRTSTTAGKGLVKDHAARLHGDRIGIV